MDAETEEMFTEIKNFLGEQFLLVKDKIAPGSSRIPIKPRDEHYTEAMQLALRIAREYREYSMALNKK